MAPVISVRGEARLERAPDEARLTVRLEALDGDRRKVLDRLGERNSACLRLLEGLPVETSGISVYPEHGSRGEKIKRYRGSVALTVTVTDFARLGELVVRLADQEQTSLDGPVWSLRDDNPVHAQARRAAVADAVRRAKEYAEALGCRLTGLAELGDEGTETDGMGFGYGGGARMMLAKGDFAEAAPIELEPERQSVRAAVVARFTATDPEEL